jgi:DNA polymerase-3 subunit chi
LTESRPRIDFYILKNQGAGGRLRFACRLNEKAYVLKNRVFNLADSPAQAKQLDELMWTFKAGSFIPHEIQQADGDPAAPVVIGFEPPMDPSGNLLINLTDDIPACFDRFDRIAEIIDPTEKSRRSGRTRYAFYRENGYEPLTHNIG